MGKNILRGVGASFFLGVFASAVWAADFSADMVSKFENETMTTKVYVSGEKTRMDMQGNPMIIRNDKKISWILMPTEKMYMEHPVNVSTAPKTSIAFDNETERTSLGMDTVDGQQAEKFQVTYMDEGKAVSVYQWIVNQAIPIKIEALDGSFGMEYKNLSVAPQPADLFEIPADYTKMVMPSMGSMMEMMGQ